MCDHMFAFQASDYTKSTCSVAVEMVLLLSHDPDVKLRSRDNHWVIFLVHSLFMQDKSTWVQLLIIFITDSSVDLFLL